MFPATVPTSPLQMGLHALRPDQQLPATWSSTELMPRRHRHSQMCTRSQTTQPHHTSTPQTVGEERREGIRCRDQAIRHPPVFMSSRRPPNARHPRCQDQHGTGCKLPHGCNVFVRCDDLCMWHNRILVARFPRCEREGEKEETNLAYHCLAYRCLLPRPLHAMRRGPREQNCARVLHTPALTATPLATAQRQETGHRCDGGGRRGPGHGSHP